MERRKLLGKLRAWLREAERRRVPARPGAARGNQAAFGTPGLLPHALVHAAATEDREGGVLRVGSLFGPSPLLLKLYTASGCQGPAVQQALRRVWRTMNLEIGERPMGWHNRCRRVANDRDCLNRNALAFLRRASIRVMVRRRCQTS
jgi:hypothetical protein